MRFQLDGALSIYQRAIWRCRSMATANMGGGKEVV
jgi:hypothetical protein